MAELGKCDFKCNQRSTLFIENILNEMKMQKNAFFVNNK